MRIGRSLMLTGIALGLPVVSISVVAQERRVSRACRAEIVSLCGMDRSNLRSCLSAQRDALSSACQGELRETARKRRATGLQETGSDKPNQSLSTGPDQHQGVDLFLLNARPGASPAPVVMFIHGGGWQIGDRAHVQAKPAFLNSLGYGFASAGYRLVPKATVEEQAADLARAVSVLRREAPRLGLDPDAIVLMGHSAGAHLAALIASDPGYLGDDLAAIRGVILLDGAGYDVAEQMRNAPMLAQRFYKPAFGDDPSRQKQLSPLSHAALPNAPNWLILHVADRAESRKQSQTLGDALRQAGANVTVKSISATDHGRLNRELGQPGLDQTSAVAEFLGTVFAP